MATATTLAERLHNIEQSIETLSESVSNLSVSPFKVVSSLPDVASAEADVIYFVPSSATGEQNVYIEYALIDGAFEKVGEYTASIDLTPYATKEELTAVSNAIPDTSNMLTKTEASTTYQPKGDYVAENSLSTINGNSLTTGEDITIVGEKGEKGDSGVHSDDAVVVVSDYSGDGEDTTKVYVPSAGNMAETKTQLDTLQLRTEGELLYDWTYEEEKLQPTAYDSTTGYFECESFPSWCDNLNNQSSNAALCYTHFNTMSSLNMGYLAKLPPNTRTVHSLIKVDSNHFLCKNATGNTTQTYTSEFVDRIADIYFGNAAFYKVFDCKEWRKVRIKLENGKGYASYYGAVHLNGTSCYMSMANLGTGAQNWWSLSSDWQVDIEWVEKNSHDFYLTNFLRCDAIYNNGYNVRTTYSKNELHAEYSTHRAMQSENTTNSIIIGSFIWYSSSSELKHGTNIKIYGLEKWEE